MSREYVDFGYIPPHQVALHERLQNWARWQRPNRLHINPMFRLYRTTEQWVPNTITVIDGLDAQEIQKAVGHIPTRNRLALGWYYVTEGPPWKAAKRMGETQQGLADLVIQGRTMLMNYLTSQPRFARNAGTTTRIRIVAAG